MKNKIEACREIEGMLESIYEDQNDYNSLKKVISQFLITNHETINRPKPVKTLFTKIRSKFDQNQKVSCFLQQEYKYATVFIALADFKDTEMKMHKFPRLTQIMIDVATTIQPDLIEENVFDNIYNTIKDFSSNLWKDLCDVITEVYDTLKNTHERAKGGLRTFGLFVRDEIKEYLGNNDKSLKQ